MGNIDFAWDRRKARSNLVKHGVSFEDAQSVFLDESARLSDIRIILPMKIGFSYRATAFGRDVSSSAIVTAKPAL